MADITSEAPKKRTPKKQYLTMNLLKTQPQGWETVFVYPLPRKPSYRLLCAAHLAVEYYLYCNLVRTILPKEDIPKVLQRGFDKMHEIALLVNKTPRVPDDEVPEDHYEVELENLENAIPETPDKP